ncbi:MAG: alkaline phosphatase, partial [Saprospiraceae bacterium]|nr:alkaline phosphatase [Saprospiraceae bacterium]
SDTIPVKTILEEAEEKSMSTGLVATSTIVHATPASFISHNLHRRNYEEIAADFLKTDIDFFVGGGKKYFDRRTLDDRNLIAELKAKGYQMSDYFSEDFEDVRITKDKFGFLTSDEEPLPVLSGRNYLLEASKKAVNHLSKKNDEGFFLMIEGSQIDWGGHANVSDYIVSEFIEFDKVIKEMVKWANKDKNTLVIVTSDHETGGYSINMGSTKDTLVTAFTSDYHTGTMIPVFAHGPGAHRFSGIYENTAIYNKMRMALNWEPLTDRN